jgi:hypothetical protein
MQRALSAQQPTHFLVKKKVCAVCCSTRPELTKYLVHKARRSAPPVCLGDGGASVLPKEGAPVREQASDPVRDRCQQYAASRARAFLAPTHPRSPCNISSVTGLCVTYLALHSASWRPQHERTPKNDQRIGSCGHMDAWRRQEVPMSICGLRATRSARLAALRGDAVCPTGIAR